MQIALLSSSSLLALSFLPITTTGNSSPHCLLHSTIHYSCCSIPAFNFPVNHTILCKVSQWIYQNFANIGLLAKHGIFSHLDRYITALWQCWLTKQMIQLFVGPFSPQLYPTFYECYNSSSCCRKRVTYKI